MIQPQVVLPCAYIAQSSATDSQEFPSRLQKPSLWRILYSVIAHSTDSNQFSCPELWSLPLLLSGSTEVCLDPSSLNKVGKFSPKRELSNCGAHLMSFPSLSDWNFTLVIIHCLTRVASFTLSSFIAVYRRRASLIPLTPLSSETECHPKPQAGNASLHLIFKMKN